jgi:hypothetical protein
MPVLFDLELYSTTDLIHPDRIITQFLITQIIEWWSCMARQYLNGQAGLIKIQYTVCLNEQLCWCLLNGCERVIVCVYSTGQWSLSLKWLVELFTLLLLVSRRWSLKQLSCSVRLRLKPGHCLSIHLMACIQSCSIESKTCLSFAPHHHHHLSTCMKMMKCRAFSLRSL